MGKLLDVLLALFLIFVVFFLLTKAIPYSENHLFSFSFPAPILPTLPGPDYPSGSSSGNGYTYEPPTSTGEVYGFDRIQAELSKLRANAELSPYQDKIDFFASGIGSSDPNEEYLTINIRNEGASKILLTGWRVQSDITGNSVTIPKGTFFPYLGGVNYEEPVFVSPGDTMYLISGRSPVGASFQTNKCTGYFSQFQTFTPSLSIDCPRPEETLPRAPNRLPDSCINYIDSLPSCHMPIEEAPSDLTPECLSFLSTEISYSKCIDQHKNDRDFYKGVWYIYLDRTYPLWKQQREVIKLLDTTGKTAGIISY